MTEGRNELFIILVTMVLILIFAITASVIFFRVWRKERKK